MQRSLNMYNILQGTKRKVSLSTFYRYHPKFVKLQGRIPLRQSCCEKCLNFDNILKQAAQYLSGIPEELNKAVDVSMCKYEGYFPSINCVKRKCTDCNLDGFKHKLFEANASKLDDQRKHFLVKEWITKTKENNGATQSYLYWKVHHCSYSDLINMYVRHVAHMSEHTFFASWNYVQFKKCRNNLQIGDVLIVNDFAQNYLCLHQNEPQGMHWEHKQVTLHPTVVYFRCKDCYTISTHEVVHTSNDLKHDAHIIKKFNEKTLQVLKDRGIEIRKIIYFSDQAPSQYKNKTSFNYMCQTSYAVMINFFGTRHGKGPCDGCAGHVKQKVATLVKTETAVVNSPETFYEFCKKEIEKAPTPNGKCEHFVQTFQYTPKLPKRPKVPNLAPIPDTRKLHSLVTAANRNVINYKYFLCCCDGCMHGGECTNNICPEAWKAFSMTKKCKVQVSLRKWNLSNPQIRKITRGIDGDYNWEEILDVMSCMLSFEQLEAYVKSSELPPLQYTLQTTMTEALKSKLDFVALHYLPPDAPDSYAPLEIVGDGNCFPRTVSFMLFGTEGRHIEIRVCIVYEAVLNKAKYLDNSYLHIGANHEYRRGTLVEQFAQYSDNYMPNVPLDCAKIYDKEVLDICKINSFMGIWQIFQTANLIGHPINSVYPANGNRNIRLDMNRKVLCYNQNLNLLECLNVMWTPMQVANTRPCHFVPLLKVVR